MKETIATSSKLRWGITVIFTLIFIDGFLGTNLESFIKEKHWDSFLITLFNTSANADIHWWYWFIAGLITGMTITAWLNRWVTDKDFKSKPDEILEVKSGEIWTENAHLTLIFDRELQYESAIKQENVLYYYWSHVPGIEIDYENKRHRAALGYVMVFVSLKDPTYTNYSRAQVIGGGIPVEVLSTHSAGAVVRAMGDMRGRTLDIRFSKDPIPLN